MNKKGKSGPMSTFSFILALVALVLGSIAQNLPPEKGDPLMIIGTILLIIALLAPIINYSREKKKGIDHWSK